MRRASVAVTLALLLVAPLVAGDVGDASARPRYRYKTSRIAPGLTLTRILDRRAPNQIRVLTMAPRSRLSLDMALAYGTLPGLEPTPDIARRKGALAAINGSIFLPWGRPVGIFAADGDLEATPLVYGNAFALSQDERSSYFGHPETRVETRILETGTTWRVRQWNESDPDPDKLAIVTPHGGAYVKPPVNSCSARLYPVSKKRWGLGDVGVSRDYTVDRVRCRYDRMLRRGGIVLAARRDGRWADDVGALIEGQTVRVSWDAGWRQALDVSAGNPLLIENGRNVGYNCDAHFCDRHPRTGVGVRRDGKVLLVTVDGRQKKWSRGMTPREFANIFQRLGATWAINLDGGGSTTMVVRGRIVNRPSGSLRPVGTAILVMNRRDRGEDGPEPYAPPPEPEPTPTFPAPTLSPTESPPPPLADEIGALFGGVIADPVMSPKVPRSGRSVLTDPASTGGYLEALASGEIRGARPELPLSLRRIVDVFRAARRERR